MDVEDDPGRVAEEEDEDDAEQDEAQVDLPPLPPRGPEPLNLNFDSNHSFPDIDLTWYVTLYLYHALNMVHKH